MKMITTTVTAAGLHLPPKVSIDDFKGFIKNCGNLITGYYTFSGESATKTKACVDFVGPSARKDLPKNATLYHITDYNPKFSIGYKGKLPVQDTVSMWTTLDDPKVWKKIAKSMTVRNGEYAVLKLTSPATPILYYPFFKFLVDAWDDGPIEDLYKQETFMGEYINSLRSAKYLRNNIIYTTKSALLSNKKGLSYEVAAVEVKKKKVNIKDSPTEEEAKEWKEWEKRQKRYAFEEDLRWFLRGCAELVNIDVPCNSRILRKDEWNSTFKNAVEYLEFCVNFFEKEGAYRGKITKSTPLYGVFSGNTYKLLYNYESGIKPKVGDTFTLPKTSSPYPIIWTTLDSKEAWRTLAGPISYGGVPVVRCLPRSFRPKPILTWEFFKSLPKCPSVKAVLDSKTRENFGERAPEHKKILNILLNTSYASKNKLVETKSVILPIGEQDINIKVIDVLK